MSSVYYRIYLNQVMNLAKTMVIKSSATADAMNQQLTDLGRTVSSDP